MDQVISKQEVTKMLDTIEHLMETYGIDEKLAVAVLRKYSGFIVDLNLTELMILQTQGLLDDEHELIPGSLWEGRDVVQGSLDLPFSSAKSSNIDSSEYVKIIEDNLVPDKDILERYTTKFAKEYFGGDLTLGYYFSLMRFVYPPRFNDTHSSKWLTHFKVQYNGTNLWSPNKNVAKKFKEIYVKKDIGVFLVGVYLAVLDSVKLESNECYMTSLLKFLNNYDTWYDYALERIEAKLERNEKVKTAPIKRATKADTL